MKQERDSLFDRIVNRAGAAKAMRDGVLAAKATLDKRGVVHKSLSDEVVVKGLIDNIGTAIDGVLSKLMDNPPPELKDAIMQTIIASIGQLAPAETGTPETPPASEGEMATMSMDETAKKQLTLLDQLITTQETLTTDQGAILKELNALKPLADLAGKYEALTKEVTEFKTALGQMQKQLSGRPRAASQAQETVVTDKELADAVNKSLMTVDPVFGKVKPLSSSGD
jgi:hypothetical protein